MEETLKNLHKAFAGESQARNRYTMSAKQAKKDGYEQLAAIFEETAEHEREHAKQLSKMINGLVEKMGKEQGPIQIEAEGAAMFGDTATNLKNAIAGEHFETTTMYPEFAKQAQVDGLPEIAVKLNAIGKAEAHHEERYGKLLKEVEAKTMFKKDEEKVWICRKCGYEHKGNTPPAKCPACSHETAYYQLKCEEY
ncbi:MAG: rubrerythrin family protein [Candidatus Diapherotrites archaeon]|uniref:Rubrerythrin family protein n=1 Tax=Candidatus Iainarchaeum sp. TaxID=3101447 RepID=A0A8T5GGA1_9ARCH|nr:rubrerythrin family protein [Candidatus Diapherotrites archaeon]MBT7241122.1 rubrerythrin family protein [Candidatus Diapherotrites archaeon]